MPREQLTIKELVESIEFAMRDAGIKGETFEGLRVWDSREGECNWDIDWDRCSNAPEDKDLDLADQVLQKLRRQVNVKR